MNDSPPIVVAGSRPWNRAAVESLTRNLSARILSLLVKVLKITSEKTLIQTSV
jgi:hypothetical protein